MSEQVKKCIICDKYKTDDPHIHRFKKRKPEPKTYIHGPSKRRAFKSNLDVIEDNPARWGH